MRSLAVAFVAASLGCSSSSQSAPQDVDAGLADDAQGDVADAADAFVDKTASCVSTFGNAIGSVGFARFDGTVLAVLAPGNKTCVAPNATHLVIELEFSGAAYRMVVDVDDLGEKGTIHMATLSHALVGGPWQDGVRAVPLDYVSVLGVHASSLVSTPTADAVAAITDALSLGAHVSVFATAQGEVDSAHLVHRNLNGQDGAIVVDVDGASPKWLLFSFANQPF